MFNSIQHAGALSVALLTCASAAAQTTVRPDPSNATATVPAVAYQSAFSSYRSARDDSKPQTWREANDNAARIGGWRVYAREAQTTDVQATPVVVTRPTTTAAPAAAAAPANAHQHPKP